MSPRASLLPRFPATGSELAYLSQLNPELIINESEREKLTI
jgi:hypothetical protein